MTVTVWAFWCESEQCVHYSFESRAIAEDWRIRYDEYGEMGRLCGPHQLIPCTGRTEKMRDDAARTELEPGPQG